MIGSGHLVHGPLPGGTFHLCIDMQCLFDRGGPWPTPWLEAVRPKVLALARFAPRRTFFSRFVPPARAGDVQGSWRRFYQRWPESTLEHLDAGLLELLPELKSLEHDAHVVDRPHYSAYRGSRLLDTLREAGCEALIVSGAETDVCVLATVLETVDAGIRCIIASDAICSSNDETHEAMMKLYSQRFAMQVEIASTGEILRQWGLLRGHPPASEKMTAANDLRSTGRRAH